MFYIYIFLEFSAIDKYIEISFFAEVRKFCIQCVSYTIAAQRTTKSENSTIMKLNKENGTSRLAGQSRRKKGINWAKVNDPFS